jgi:segregation and condensation protein A
MEKLEVDDLADFIVVAARLILIKSQALLPRPPTPTSEEEDAGEELIRQLLAYKEFKRVAQQLEERHAQGQRSYIRLAAAPQIEAGIEHLDPVELDALVAAAHQAMRAQLASVSRTELGAPFTLTIKDQIRFITDTLTRRSQIGFTKLLTSSYSRQEVSVTLLAVLELVKRQEIQARQEYLFGEITITTCPVQPV